MSNQQRVRETVQGAIEPHYGEIHIRNRGRLPHWEKDSGLYFLTFRLADSLPRHVLARIAERNRILAAAKHTNANLTPEEKVLIADFNAQKVEAYADRGAGSCVLRNPSIAKAMADALRHGHGQQYRLIAWCIMPNHVHVICRLLPGFQLGEIIKAWKRCTAGEANRLLGRTGTLWQREYYDRLIRREGELDRAISYVLGNPEWAGLKDWPWIWMAPEALTEPGEVAP